MTIRNRRAGSMKKAQSVINKLIKGKITSVYEYQ